MPFNLKNYLENTFKDSPSKLKVASKMVIYGLSVRDGRLYCNDVEIPYKSLASACEVDQRVIKSTAMVISRDETLSRIFSSISASLNLKDAAKELGFGVLVIASSNFKEPGIIASVSKVLADFNVSIVQAIIEDPEFIEEPKLYMITEQAIPGQAIPKIRNLKNVKSVTII